MLRSERPVPFSAATYSILAVANNGDGTYTLTFDQPVTVAGTHTTQYFGLYSPSDGGVMSVIWRPEGTPTTTVTVEEVADDTDCTLFFVTAIGFDPVNCPGYAPPPVGTTVAI